ncbi:MAG: hypothetical protein AAGC55_16330, partial [Myxococcota bacterium]
MSNNANDHRPMAGRGSEKTMGDRVDYRRLARELAPYLARELVSLGILSPATVDSAPDLPEAKCKENGGSMDP